MFDSSVLNLLKLLNKAGYEAYLVGGVVRDYLLGFECHDYDACTNATPLQIKEIYKEYQIFSYGEKYGTIGINYEGNLIEITTFRSEDGYVDNRHPRIVKFDATLESDVLRRDFTINAIAYDVKNEKIVDLVGGIKDLNEAIIRCVGIPHERFIEDSLRIFRAIRFSARFKFRIEEETKQAIFSDHKLLKNISKERITEEVSKIAIGGIENIIEEYYEVFKYLIPELKGINLGLLKLNTNELVYKLAILFSDVANLDKAINNFRFPNSIVYRVKSIIRNNDLVTNNDLVNTRILLHKMGLEYYKDLNGFHKLIGLSYTNIDTLDEAIKLGYENRILAINGRGVKAALGADGKEIKDAIEEVFSEVVKGNLENDRLIIKEYLFNKYGKTNYLKKKIEIIKLINSIFKKHNAIFSIGASCMLYFRGVVDYFGDLDLSVSKADYEKVKEELDRLATNPNLKWGYIYNFKINGVDIDLVIKEESVLNCCDLEYNLDNDVLHLESLDYWYKRYYELERFNRCKQIRSFLGGKNELSSNN